MSERRMFAKSITESDAFLDLPLSAQALYFHMAMNADDEGFINSSRRICGMCGAGEADLDRLVLAGFVIRFDSGIFVIKHWKINNRIRSDRCKSTNYPDEKAMLWVKENGVYSLKTQENGRKEKAAREFHAEYDEQAETNADDSALAERTAERTEAAESLGYDATPEPKKNFAEQIFDILFAHNLPCCNGNIITFTMRDFKLANSALNNLHLHSDEVIAAVKNYAQVIDLKRQGLTWWNSEQTFYNFCEKKTILKFLPENFKIEDFMRKDTVSSPNEEKIRL